MAAANAFAPHPRLSGIYAIVNDTHADPVRLSDAVLAAGVRIVQYRAKQHFSEDHVRAIRALTRACNAIFILNDRWRDVERFDADGAHVGPDDAQREELPQIRKALNSRIFGVSCGTPQEARTAQAAGADYLGVGSVYATSSKDDAGTPIGLAGLRAVLAVSTVPAAAIGGITAQNILAVRQSGAAMAAVISAIAASSEPRAAAHALVQAWQA